MSFITLEFADDADVTREILVPAWRIRSVWEIESGVRLKMDDGSTIYATTSIGLVRYRLISTD